MKFNFINLINSVMVFYIMFIFFCFTHIKRKLQVFFTNKGWCKIKDGGSNLESLSLRWGGVANLNSHLYFFKISAIIYNLSFKNRLLYIFCELIY